MDRCKVTVLKKTLSPELAQEYIGNPVQFCPVFTEGQEFVSSETFEKPVGFCDWAWNDIFKVVVALSRGGNFSDGLFEGWMKNEQAMIVCCTDGIRPVVFKVERLPN